MDVKACKTLKRLRFGDDVFEKDKIFEGVIPPPLLNEIRHRTGTVQVLSEPEPIPVIEDPAPEPERVPSSLRPVELPAVVGLPQTDDVAPSMDDLSPGQRLKVYREVAELSQKALAEKLGVVATTVSSWERSKMAISKNMAERMAKLFEVETEVFIK